MSLSVRNYGDVISRVGRTLKGYINNFVGVYAIRPPLPAVGGGEGVGVVTSVGDGVTTLSKGDRVVVARPGAGKIPLLPSLTSRTTIGLPRIMGRDCGVVN